MIAAAGSGATPMNGDPELSLVIPVYNEKGSLPALDGELRAALHAAGRTAEILYVDDGSNDGSPEVLRRLVEAARGGEFRTRVLRLRRNYGQTAAMAAGFEAAQGQVILPLDADGQNNPADLERLLAELEKGYDIVSGWRRRRKDRAISRKLPSRVANWLIGRISGVRLHDYGCTLKAYRAPLLKDLRLYGEMHRFIPLYLGAMGARVGELEVDHRPRTTGVSKYGSRRIMKVLLDLVLIRFMVRYYTRPMHFFGQAALGFASAAIFVVFLMVAFKFGWLRLVGIDYRASFIQTPLPALAGSLLIGAILSLFFGILAEILIRIHYESRSVRPYAIGLVLDSDSEPSGLRLGENGEPPPRAEARPSSMGSSPALARSSAPSATGS
jgi:glycosyltransferase involved in cell wall biosynthesis